MKKLLLISIFVIFYSLTTKAQQKKDILVKQNSWQTEAGFLFAPQGYFDFKNIKAGSTFVFPLYTMMSFTKGKLTFIPNYSLTYNGYGVVISYQTSKIISNYLVLSKNTTATGGYVGTGINFPLSNGAFGIVELGTPTLKSSRTAQLYFGIGIPATFKIKKK